MVFCFLPVVAVAALAVAASPAAAQAVPPVQAETGVLAYPFDISQVTLNPGRWQQNQERTRTYLKFIDLDRLLYNYRATHGLSTNGAATNGGWDAPDFPFRSHMQGHFLTAWAQCWSATGDTECRDRAVRFAAELVKCQANNAAAGFTDGYLSGFPESDFDALEGGTLTNGNVPYYVVHKLLAGLLDVWRTLGDANARDALLALAGWVDARTAPLDYAHMQTVLNTEFGGMSEVLADVYYQTGDARWLDVAQRFEHAAVLAPLAANRDQLSGLHANTQVPKWIGAARAYKATGNATLLAVARNAWDMTTAAHTYAIGGNSQAEHFRAPDAIAAHLTADTAEACNTYNMLKLTRELWTLDPARPAYFDYYEQALTNHLVGQQDPSSAHGHVTYFSSLQAGGRRGVGPAWGGGTWSTDHASFWCCQGTGVETNTKLADSVFFRDADGAVLWLNLFAPAELRWPARNLSLALATAFPAADSATLTVEGAADFELRVRVPAWTSGATIAVNGVDAGVPAEPGTYAVVSRAWADGDEVAVRLPMGFRTVAANDDAGVAALAYGPVVLVGDYGDADVAEAPVLDLASVRRTSEDALEFEAEAGGEVVRLVPFFDAQGFNYVTYWRTSGQLP
ncbi:putative secreted protein [Neofusicoccum parvum UCRNP2]|uniref:Putative secreted protein n=1 Tax=Botryosphaeria parva (strain UCR-NP2) TaxID=1287680 RepID=R1G8Q6_BOTPV|nr:putative secreted protein [Neofusicoccum parvum UCRNP2]